MIDYARDAEIAIKTFIKSLPEKVEQNFIETARAEFPELFQEAVELKKKIDKTHIRHTQEFIELVKRWKEVNYKLIRLSAFKIVVR